MAPQLSLAGLSLGASPAAPITPIRAAPPVTPPRRLSGPSPKSPTQLSKAPNPCPVSGSFVSVGQPSSSGSVGEPLSLSRDASPFGILPVSHSAEVVSCAPTIGGNFLTLKLRLRGSEKIQNALLLGPESSSVYYTPENSPASSPLCTVNAAISNDPNYLTPTPTPALLRVVDKIPGKILASSNFGNPWYILELQDTRHGGPHCSLVPTWAYQLVLSSLKTAGQLRITLPRGGDGPMLFNRSEIGFEEELGHMSYASTLDGQRVFVKSLNLTRTPGARDLDIIEQLGCIYYEIKALNHHSPHPNIAQPPMAYIYHGGHEGSRNTKLIGFVTEFYKYGRLSEFLFAQSITTSAGTERKRRDISLLQKAKWALQMSAAMVHLHRKSKMTLGQSRYGFGLERFFVDQYLQLRLSGFGKNVNKEMLAPWRFPPEGMIRGEWEVREVHNSRAPPGSQKTLKWRRYEYAKTWFEDQLKKKLAKKENPTTDDAEEDPGDAIYPDDDSIYAMLDSYVTASPASEDGYLPTIFEEWKEIPNALEVVETYSLGVMLWMMFEQVPPGVLDVTGKAIIEMEWSSEMGIPKEWQVIVENCVNPNPGNRIPLDEVSKFFVREVGLRWDGGWVMG